MTNETTQTSTRNPIDERKREMLDTLFMAVHRAETNASPDNIDNTDKEIDLDTSISATIGELVRHFRTLLEKVEGRLPEDTKFCSTHMLALDAKRAGHMVKALQDAVDGILDQCPADDSPARTAVKTEAKTAYENTYKALERFNNESIANAANLYKIVGKAIAVVPKGLFTDDRLYKTFLEEVKERDDLRDENTLRQTVLSFALKHDKKEIAISAIEFDSEMCQRFITDNFDWICEGASETWIMDMILEVEVIRNDHVKTEKLLKKLAEGEGLVNLFVNGNNNLRCSKEFAHYLAKWALLNLSSVKSNIDLRYLALVAVDEDFHKLIDELEKRTAWYDITRIRISCHDRGNRHYAQQVLDRNVNSIPIDWHNHGLEYNCEQDEEPCTFAIIGTIGIDESARLRAVERIREEGKEEKVIWRAGRILEIIIKGWNGYRNPAVEEATRKALEELKAIRAT